MSTLEKVGDKLKESLRNEVTLTIRMRYMAGISGVLLLIVGIIFIAYTYTITKSWQITRENIACLLIGAMLILMSIKPE